jgi:lipoprotein-anchoring transpeptidase ErfK/SrfK
MHRLALLILFLALPLQAAAERLVVQVEVAHQRMTVLQDGAVVRIWPVSTARPGKVTPRGHYRPQTLVKFHRSRLYNGAPMPWTIFYDGNYAIHGTSELRKLGRPASAGCVRLHPENARLLWQMVRAIGADETRIVVLDEAPRAVSRVQ